MKKNKPDIKVPGRNMREKVTQLEKIATKIEAIRLGEYIATMNKPLKIIWVNLLGGISRGVGLTLGATLVVVVLFKVLTMVVRWDLPYISNVVGDLLATVSQTPGMEKFKEALVERDVQITEKEIGVVDHENAGTH